MGSCIGKKSGAQNKQSRHSSSTVSTTKSHFNNQLSIKQILPSSSSEQTSILISCLSVVKESDTLFNQDEKSKEEVIQCRSSSSLSITTNDQFLFVHTPATSSPGQLSIQCKKFKSSNTVIDFSENNITHPISLITNEQDIPMGHLFSKERDINNDQEVPKFTQEILSASVNSSRSPSLTDSSFSSLSRNTTPFSSQDQLILSSSSSSANSHCILPSHPLTNHNKFHSLPYTEQISFHKQSSTEIFSPILPVSFSRCNNDLFLNEFHQNTVSYNCTTLSSVIDDIVQQQYIRIHRRTKTLLIEHKQFECVQLNDIKKFDTPSLIFDNNQKFVYITKYARWNGLQSITCNTKDAIQIFSSCDHCVSLLSGSKLNNYLRQFLLVNTTYNLIQMCFNEINNNTTFGFISQINPNHIRQTIINNSKLTYSNDLDVNHTSFYFVLRVQSWPQELRTIFEQRARLWPLNIENLFDNTCFIRFNGNEHETPTTDRCHSCEKMLSSLTNATWSYTYTAIENQLILAMSDGHIRFASILWNYLNGKLQGQLPFIIFKHTLFYFFEQYSSDLFIPNDLLTYVHLFINFLFNRLQTKSIPHYFNANYNLYNDSISINDLTSIKITYLDLKNFSVYLLPKSSLYLYQLIYLIQFQSNFLHYLRSAKTNLIQTILETHELVIKQLSLGVKTYKQQLDSIIAIKSHRPLTLDCLYRYQEENVQIILDYLPLLREKEPSLLIHSLWCIFIQYFNSLFDDLFIS